MNRLIPSGIVILIAVSAHVLAQESPTCQVSFAATVHQGPSTGATIGGLLTYEVAEDGALTGTIVQSDATGIPVAGQVTGRAIHLILFFAGPKHIFGVGTSATPFSGPDCGVVFGGPFVGPDGDAGDWIGGWPPPPTEPAPPPAPTDRPGGDTGDNEPLEPPPYPGD